MSAGGCIQLSVTCSPNVFLLLQRNCHKHKKELLFAFSEQKTREVHQQNIMCRNEHDSNNTRNNVITVALAI